MDLKKEKKAPCHLCFIAIFFIFIYANGVYDYFMMLGHNMDYYNAKGYGEAVVQYFTDYPITFLLLYTTNVFTRLIAPILLLLKKKIATTFAISVEIIDSIFSDIICSISNFIIDPIVKILLMSIVK